VAEAHECERLAQSHHITVERPADRMFHVLITIPRGMEPVHCADPYRQEFTAVTIRSQYSGDPYSHQPFRHHWLNLNTRFIIID